MTLFKQSLKHRIIFSLLILILGLAALILAAIYFDIDLLIGMPIIFLIGLLVGLSLVNYIYKPFELLIESIETGLNCLRDDDFSISLTSLDFSEFKAGIDTYNELADILRKERLELHQRELLLDTIIQSTPMAIVLTTSNGIIVYNNNTARRLLKHAGRIKSLNFETLYTKLPEELRNATANRQDGLYNVTENDSKKVYFLTFQEFTINSQTHYLYIYKNMTSEVTREELLIWKKVIKLISHELNNSLAPIQSLSHSAIKLIADMPDNEMLTDILQTIGRRTEHLHQFIEKYSKFSRLPTPSYNPVDIEKFIGGLEQICTIKILKVGHHEDVKFDAIQIEQVLINLIKNAKESGGEVNDISVQFELSNQTILISVKDRGCGMNERQLKKALLPFYTTKSYGTGLGLALSNEIINAHKGKLRLYNRKQGGLAVIVEIPYN